MQQRRENIYGIRKSISKLAKKRWIIAGGTGVTRQTISKWELGETSPDIKDAKELSNIFHISLDKLVGNDIKNIIIEKISNTEKLAGMLIKIIKWFGIGIFVLFLIDIFIFIIFTII